MTLRLKLSIILRFPRKRRRRSSFLPTRLRQVRQLRLPQLLRRQRKDPHVPQRPLAGRHVPRVAENRDPHVTVSVPQEDPVPKAADLRIVPHPAETVAVHPQADVPDSVAETAADLRAEDPSQAVTAETVAAVPADSADRAALAARMKSRHVVRSVRRTIHVLRA